MFLLIVPLYHHDFMSASLIVRALIPPNTASAYLTSSSMISVSMNECPPVFVSVYLFATDTHQHGERMTDREVDDLFAAFDLDTSLDTITFDEVWMAVFILSLCFFVSSLFFISSLFHSSLLRVCFSAFTLFLHQSTSLKSGSLLKHSQTFTQMTQQVVDTGSICRKAFASHISAKEAAQQQV
jgi:hypothetical protein